MIIRGTASTTLLFALGGGLRMHDCRNVTLEAVTIDYAPLLPYVQARIASVFPVFPVFPVLPVLARPARGCAKLPRPEPPCPGGWWASGGACDQGCPSNAQGRDPSTGRCLCGQAAPPDRDCFSGQRCVDGQCCPAAPGPPGPPPPPPPPPPPAPVRYTLELAPRSLPLRWPDVAHGVLWSGVTNRSKHEAVPTPGAAVPLGGNRFSWTSAAIPGAEAGDYVTFAGRDNYTVVVANSTCCALADVAILSAPGFAITEIDGAGGHTYTRVRVGSHGAQAAGSEQPRLVGANADAFHSVDVAHGPLLDSCDFSGNCDDFANVHSTLHVLYAPRAAVTRAGAAPRTPGALRVLVIDPRLVALGATPLQGRVDEWYGTSSPLANSEVGDTLSCYQVNKKPRYARGNDSWAPWGAKLRLLSVPVEVRNETMLAEAAAVRSAINAAGANPALYGWKSLKLWSIAVAPVTGTAQPPIPICHGCEPAVICDVDRYGGRGAVLRNNYFHDLGTNGGIRWKSSGSTIERNMIVRAGNASSTVLNHPNSGVEVSALQDWMEGPAVIANVLIEGNHWIDCGVSRPPVTVCPRDSNVTIRNNTAS